jgi:hypothetical protein
MAGNSNLHDSARNKQDEFYTQLSLIEKELKHYRSFFAGKTVLCNCDDPYESNFFKYFIIHNFDVKVTLGGDDPSDTALGYGAVCAVVYPVMGRLYTSLNIEDYTADVVCDFNEDSKTTAFAYLYGSIRIIFILKIALGALFKLIKTYLKMKFR